MNIAYCAPFFPFPFFSFVKDAEFETTKDEQFVSLTGWGADRRAPIDSKYMLMSYLYINSAKL